MAHKVEITEELKARINQRYQTLVAKSLTTEPAPRADIEAAIANVYRLTGVKKPESFIWVESDVAAADIIRANGQDPSNNNLWGQYDMYWLAKLQVAEEEIGGVIGDQKQMLDCMMVLTKSGPWWPFSKVIVCCDTPELILVNEAGEPHCEDGPAIRYRDGVEYYYIGGHEVSRQTVMAPETLTVDIIKAESNAEARRIMISRYGVEKYIENTQATLIDEDKYFGHPRLLVSLEDGSKWLIGTDGTVGEDGKHRIYHMPVSRMSRSCKEAHSSISGIPESKIGVQS